MAKNTRVLYNRKEMLKVSKRVYTRKQEIITLGDPNHVFAHGLSQRLKIRTQAPQGRMVFTTRDTCYDKVTTARTQVFEKGGFMNNIDPTSPQQLQEVLQGRSFNRVVYFKPYSPLITTARNSEETKLAYHEHVKSFLKTALNYTYGVGEEPSVEEEEQEEILVEVKGDDMECVGGQIHLITKKDEDIYTEWSLGKIAEDVNKELELELAAKLAELNNSYKQWSLGKIVGDVNKKLELELAAVNLFLYH